MESYRWVLVASIAALVGCDLPFPSCGPDNNDEQLELWSVRTDGSGLSQERTGWPQRGVTYYELVGTDPAGDVLYIGQSFGDDGLYALDLRVGTYEPVFNEPFVQDFAISPDGKTVAFIQENHQLWTISLIDGRRRMLISDTLGLRAPAWTAEGDAIAYMRLGPDYRDSHTGGAWRIDLADSASHRLTHRTSAHFDLRNDGAVVYAADTVSVEGLNMYVYLKPRDQPTRTLVPGERPLFAANDRIVYVSPFAFSEPRSIRVMHADGSDVRDLASDPPLRPAVTLVDAGRAVLHNRDGMLSRIDITTGDATVVVRPDDHRVPGEERGWTNVSVGISEMIYSEEASRLFYFISKHFWDDGC